MNQGGRRARCDHARPLFDNRWVEIIIDEVTKGSGRENGGINITYLSRMFWGDMLTLGGGVRGNLGRSIKCTDSLHG